MKATDILREQHRTVERLLDKIHADSEAVHRRLLLDETSKHLRIHMLLEERIFYPAVREAIRPEASTGIVPTAYEEHEAVKMVLDSLADVDPFDQQFMAKVHVIKQLLHHHVREEESVMFPIAEKLGPERLEDLGRHMEAHFSARAEEVYDPDTYGLGDIDR
ncbi:MAG: hemerythrin domain-containing protein [Candidatus Binatia bacterium]